MTAAARDDLLALDIGNGSVKYARFVEGRVVERGRLGLEASLAGLPAAAVSAAVSVNPPVLARARAALPALRAIGEEIPVPLTVEYEPPEACGLDRVIGVLGAFHLHPGARAVLLLDLGTCLTATLGVRGRGILGGAILPGADLMADALATGTADLPRVEVGGPVAPIGRSTEASIRLGIQAALRGAARELISEIGSRSPEPPAVVAAGTGAEALGRGVAEVDFVHPDATLWGVFRAAVPGSGEKTVTL